MQALHAFLAILIILNFLWIVNAHCIRQNNACIDLTRKMCSHSKGKK